VLGYVIVIQICTSAQLFLLHKVICRLHVSTNRPEDDYLLVETCSLHITLCNKKSYADVQTSITGLRRFRAVDLDERNTAEITAL